MATNPNSAFQKNLAFGQMAESKIARWLKSRGNVILPVYDIEYETGKGPRLALPDGWLIAPDLLVFKAKTIFWCECKHKTVFSWHRLTQRWVTGIDLRHYLDYLKVSDDISLPVWLFFLHESEHPRAQDLRNGSPATCPAGLFGNELQLLRKSENHRHGNWGNSGMVYWADSSLKLIISATSMHQFDQQIPEVA